MKRFLCGSALALFGVALVAGLNTPVTKVHTAHAASGGNDLFAAYDLASAALSRGVASSFDVEPENAVIRLRAYSKPYDLTALNAVCKQDAPKLDWNRTLHRGWQVVLRWGLASEDEARCNVREGTGE